MDLTNDDLAGVWYGPGGAIVEFTSDGFGYVRDALSLLIKTVLPITAGLDQVQLGRNGSGHVMITRNTDDDDSELPGWSVSLFFDVADRRRVQTVAVFHADKADGQVTLHIADRLGERSDVYRRRSEGIGIAVPRPARGRPAAPVGESELIGVWRDATGAELTLGPNHVLTVPDVAGLFRSAIDDGEQLAATLPAAVSAGTWLIDRWTVMNYPEFPVKVALRFDGLGPPLPMTLPIPGAPSRLPATGALELRDDDGLCLVNQTSDPAVIPALQYRKVSG
jgi:hypothetical protein